MHRQLWLVYVRVNLSARVAVAFCTADTASASCQAKPSFFFQVAMKRPAKKGPKKAAARKACKKPASRKTLPIQKKPAMRKQTLKIRKTEEMSNLNYENFKEAVREWCETSLKGRKITILTSRHVQVPLGTFRMNFWCNSCTTCHNRQGWRGFATYRDNTVRVYTTAPSEHGKEDYLYGDRESSLDDQVKSLIRGYMATNRKYRMQGLLQYLRSKLLKSKEVPDEKNIKYFIDNDRRRKKGDREDAWLAF